MGGSKELSLYLRSTEADQAGADAQKVAATLQAEVGGACRHRLKGTRVAPESPNHTSGITLRLCFWFPCAVPGHSNQSD